MLLLALLRLLAFLCLLGLLGLLCFLGLLLCLLGLLRVLCALRLLSLLGLLGQAEVDASMQCGGRQKIPLGAILQSVLWPFSAPGCQHYMHPYVIWPL